MSATVNQPTTWSEYDRALAQIAAEMVGADDYLTDHPDYATDAVIAQAWRTYLDRLRAVERPQ